MVVARPKPDEVPVIRAVRITIILLGLSVGNATNMLPDDRRRSLQGPFFIRSQDRRDDAVDAGDLTAKDRTLSSRRRNRFLRPLPALCN
jgi:hypothetical protein